jgi:glucose/arabinose dehydrogenase
MIAVSDAGHVYITRPEQNDVIMLRASGGKMSVVVRNLEKVHGIALHQNRMYLAGVTKLWAAEVNPDGMPGAPREIVSGLPDGGQHPNRTMAFGPDGMYVSIGSTCNNCDETNPEHAAILRFEPDGNTRQVFARGLRNTLGFDWHPDTGQLWGMDHGSDWRGDNIPPEELNLLQAGKDYGWPFCYGNRTPDEYSSHEPKGMSKEQYCRQSEAPVMTYQAHSAPIGFVFYRGTSFPAEYRGDAFVAMRGSWNRRPPTGYKIVRIRFQNGKPVGFQDFVTGFLSLDGRSFIGRPAGVAVAKDGSLLVTDDQNGVLYRVAYRKAG